MKPYSSIDSPNNPCPLGSSCLGILGRNRGPYCLYARNHAFRKNRSAPDTRFAHGDCRAQRIACSGAPWHAPAGGFDSPQTLARLSGDPILVRSGSGVQPTDAALRMLQPSAEILQAAEHLFTEARAFDPRSAVRTFRIAASDYLDPQFLPKLVAYLKKHAPLCTVEIMALSHDVDYSGELASGDVDVVIGNWPQPRGVAHGAAVCR